MHDNNVTIKYSVAKAELTETNIRKWPVSISTVKINVYIPITPIVLPRLRIVTSMVSILTNIL